MNKKISFILVTLLISAAAWMSCQKIDEPLVIDQQREFPEIPDDTTAGNDTILNFISTYVDYKQVLLEDFTGHRCVNCPQAAKIAHNLAEDLNHKLIIIAVHAGDFATPIPGTIFADDFRSDVGNDLNENYGILFNPVALIDRVESNGSRWISKDNWVTVVTDEIGKPNLVNIKLSNTWNPEFNVVKVDIETEFLDNLEGQYKLAVYIVEDSIIAPQLNNDSSIGGDTLINYVHHNILRDAISSTYGDFLGDNGNIASGEIYSKQYPFHVNPNWVIKNCHIIAYVGKWDESLNLVDIIQVAELEIKVD